MPYNGSGVFSVVNTFVPNTTILSAAVNQNFSDIATGLSDVLTRDGQAGMTAILAMGNNKITGLADPTNAQDGATKNYVDTSLVAVWSTGDVKLTVKTTADTGWLLFADQTIGNVGSGATYANANALALYTLLWNNISSPTSNAFAPVTGGLGANAAADWAGLKPMLLLTTLGRAMAISGTGSGLTARALGTSLGEETHLLTRAEIPTGITSTGGISVTSPNASFQNLPVASGTVGAILVSTGATQQAPFSLSATWTNVTSLTGTANLTSNNTSGGVHNNMQPSTFLNAMIKL